jgi:hypothetical protein
MATTFYPKYYFYIGGVSTGSAGPRLQERVIDFAVQPIVQGNTAAMIPVPKNAMVMTAGYQTITTVTDATSSFAITDGTNTWITAAAVVAAGSYGVKPTIAIGNTNVVFAANADIQITTVTVADLTVGQVRVFALMLYPEMVPSYVDADGNTKTYTYTDFNSWTSTKPVIP